MTRDIEPTNQPATKQFPVRCVECGAREVMPAVIADKIEKRHDGITYVLDIPKLHVNRCAKRGEVYFDVESSDQVSAALRDHLHLLSPAEMRTHIDKLGLTQREVASHLGIAAETLSRWLNGSIIQSRAMDNLLRIYFSLPQARAMLRDGAAA